MEKTLVASLRPVEINGFSVAVSDKALMVEISYHGRKVKHRFFWRKKIETLQDYERMMSDALLDFHLTAVMGSKGKAWYKKTYCKDVPQHEVDNAWKEYKAAAEAFKKLTGVSASEFAKFSSN